MPMIFLDWKRWQTHKPYPVHKVYDKLQRCQRSMLIMIYCLTCFETTISFHGHGKRSIFRLLMKNAEKYQALSTIGIGSLSTAQEQS